MTLPVTLTEPWFAVAGLAAISLPLWMHLYQRVASRRVPISSLRLAPETPQIALQRRRIKHWPLFLLRVLGVVLLGAAFARPGLPGGDQRVSGGRETVVFVLDRSGSMALKSGDDSSAWEQAVELVENRLIDLHPQSRVQLICFPAAETSGEWVGPSAMRKVVAKLEPGFAEGNPLEALRQASELLARFRSDMPESLEIIGDLQQQGWENIDTLTLPEELRVRVYQTGDPEATNRGLALQVRGRDQVRRGAVVTRGGSFPLKVKDTAGSGEDEDDIVEKEFPLPDDVLELPYQSAADGWVSREVSFDQATDGLPNDDSLFDTFYVAPKIPVLLLEPHSDREAFLQTTFFILQALRPTAGDAAEDSRFIPQVVPLNNAVDALQNLDDPEVIVVVPALAEWPEELPAVVKNVANQGGAVVFFSGPDLEPGAYAKAWRDLLPALPGKVRATDRSLVLPLIRDSHPIWGGLSEVARRNLRKVDLKQRSNLTLTEGAEVLANYSDDVPFVVESPLGKGKALFVNASADRAWGDWPTDGNLFVPTIHGLMSAVVTSPSLLLRNSPGAGIVGVPFDVQTDPIWAGNVLRIGDLERTADENGWVRDLNLDTPGLFKIESEGGQFVRPVAVNFPPVESRRELFAPAILQRQIEARRRVAAGEGEAPRINLASESLWWRWILCALVFVWLAEPWLAFRPAPKPVQKGAES